MGKVPVITHFNHIICASFNFSRLFGRSGERPWVK